MPDRSNGYDAIAHEFIRTRSFAGASVVREWARSLQPGGSVLDLGCGSGVPVTQVLIDGGFSVHALDASENMINVFCSRFPGVKSHCVAVEDFPFSDYAFDGVVAWGLIFLLDAEAQRAAIAKVSTALRNGGQFLFTAPGLKCTWFDSMTGRESVSLGREEYGELLESAGLALTGEQDDEGGNHCYCAIRR